MATAKWIGSIGMFRPDLLFSGPFRQNQWQCSNMQILNWDWFCPRPPERPGFPGVGGQNIAIRFDPKRGLGRNRTLTKSGTRNKKKGAAHCAAPSIMFLAYN